MLTVHTPLKDPDEEDCDQSDDDSPEENTTLVDFTGVVEVLIFFLNKVRFESEEKKPYNYADNEEPEKVEPPVVSAIVVIVMLISCMIHAFFGQA